MIFRLGVLTLIVAALLFWGLLADPKALFALFDKEEWKWAGKFLIGKEERKRNVWA